MNVKHEQFIGVYENAFSEEYCQKAIKYFEDMRGAGFAYTRQRTENTIKLKKDDESLFSHDEEIINLNYTSTLQHEFNHLFWGKAYKDYVDNYSILMDSDKHASYAIKLQKTVPGGGYHMWHYESSTRAECNRLLAWMLYLNDVEEGGETEFLYLHKRIKPKAGTLLIWPTGFTHTHRGNPPLSGDKYIITGWVEF
jgi:hypothetical protein